MMMAKDPTREVVVDRLAALQQRAAELLALDEGMKPPVNTGQVSWAARCGTFSKFQQLAQKQAAKDAWSLVYLLGYLLTMFQWLQHGRFMRALLVNIVISGLDCNGCHILSLQSCSHLLHPQLTS